MLNKAGGDEATGHPAVSDTVTYIKYGTLSSPEDDLSSDETPCGEGINPPTAFPILKLLPHVEG